MVKLGLLKSFKNFLGSKRELNYLLLGLALLLGLLIIGFSLFNKPILENVENINKKVELTLMKPLTDSSANEAFISLYNSIKTNYSSNPNIIFEEKMCSGSILDDFLKTCTEGNLNYTNFLQAKVPSWNTNCPALLVTLSTSSVTNNVAGRTYINELGFETDKTVITLQAAKTIIDKALMDYIPPDPLPPPPPPPPLPPPTTPSPVTQPSVTQPSVTQPSVTQPSVTPTPGPPPQVPDAIVSAPSNPQPPVTTPPNPAPPVPSIQTSQASSSYPVTTTITTTTTRNTP
jgi:hypothetical protein